MRNQPSPSIERLLEKKDQCNVDELIDDEDIIQEMRNGNEKLIKFLTRDWVKRLIDYITKMPEEDDHKKGHKFPFVVNELFSLDNSKLNDKFFNEEEIVEEDLTDKKEESEDENTSKSDV